MLWLVATVSLSRQPASNGSEGNFTRSQALAVGSSIQGAFPPEAPKVMEQRWALSAVSPPEFQTHRICEQNKMFV